MQTTPNKLDWWRIVLLLFVFVIPIGTYLILTEIDNRKQIKDLQVVMPDYADIKGDNATTQGLMIAPNYLDNARGTDGWLKRNYTVNGNFSRLYLLAVLSVNGRPLSAWDSFYFKLNGIGGHMVANGNLLPTPPTGNATTLLYKLDAISYYETIGNKANSKNKQTKDVTHLFVDGGKLRIATGISSTRANRFMKEVSLYYECAPNSNCSIKAE